MYMLSPYQWRQQANDHNPKPEDTRDITKSKGINIQTLFFTAKEPIRRDLDQNPVATNADYSVVRWKLNYYQ